jgi:multidrug efflux system outer membrane protein
MTAAFRGQAEGGHLSFADLPFWEVFEDPRLLALLRAALAGNYDLVSAAARVEQARALAGVSTAALLPAVNLRAGTSYQQTFTPFNLANIPGVRPGNPRYAVYVLDGALSWEIDLWGRLRRLREAALADFLASEEVRRGVIVSLVGEVARGYFQLMALDLQLRIARRTVVSRRQTLALFQELERGGVGNRLQTAAGEANLAGAEAAVPALEMQIAQQENQLAVLLGRPPGPIDRGEDLLARPAPPMLPAGLPATLLERRPDLRQAEAALIAANAQVGAALAQFFPQLSLTGSGGVQSASLPALFTAGAATFGIGLLVNWLTPLLSGSQIKHRYEAQKANWQALVASYRQAVLNALSEVSGALIALDRLRAQRGHQEAEVRARTETVEMAKVRFRNGVASYLEVVQAEQNLFPAELQLAQTIGAQFTALALLYRALGGGWMQPAVTPAPRPAPPTPPSGP